MPDNSAEFIGDIPRHYDTGLGPNIFVDFADRLTSAACDGRSTHAIELAAGTGIVSRKLRDGLPPETALLVTDLNPPGFYKVPFHYGNPEEVRRDLKAAGWQDVKHETMRLTKKIVDPEAFARGLVYGNPLIDEIRNREGVDPEAVATAVLDALNATFGPSDMTMPLEATMFTCTAT